MLHDQPNEPDFVVCWAFSLWLGAALALLAFAQSAAK
jgi:hypothetical protein